MWLSPIIIVQKKDLCFFVDYEKVNVVIKSDTFPFPFTDALLDTDASHVMWSFLDVFSGYNQRRMAPEGEKKIVWLDTDASHVMWSFLDGFLLLCQRKICAFLDYQKFVSDTFLLPFTDALLDTDVAHVMLSFLDGFCGYRQVQMAP